MELEKLIRTPRSEELSSDETRDVLFAASEVAPYSQTGGLAEVAANLPAALSALGHRVSVITPLYGSIDAEELNLGKRLKPLVVPRSGTGDETVEAMLWEGRTDDGVRIFFVEHDAYFGRQELYGSEDGPFEDNAERFAFFSRAVVEFTRQLSVPVDILHCNDWQTALAPVYRDAYYNEELADVGTVLTIHSLAHQGRFAADAAEQLGLPDDVLVDGDLKDGDQINLLQSGIVHADSITTVSPTYAEQIQTAEGGFGLDETLREHADKLSGVLNGADYTVWSPEIDHFIEIQYDLEGLNGKRQNKANLQHEFSLPIRPTLPLVAYIGPLTEENGVDLLIEAAEDLVEDFEDDREGFQLVVVGESDQGGYADRLEALADRFPDRVATTIDDSERMAHEIQAGTDLLVIPSRHEPCGLTQLYAMKYGTLPIAHATGGLADTIVDPQDDEDAKGTGFLFEDFDAEALGEAIARATARYRNYRKWRPLIQNAMTQDFSWKASASSYIDIYNTALQRQEG